jgi:hypothetical protein
MVDPAEQFWGGTPAAESGHYRFRTKQVYLPCRIVRIRKSSTHKRVKLVATEPAALFRSFSPRVHSVCAAQYFSSSPLQPRRVGFSTSAG